VDCVYIFSSKKEEISVSVEWVLMNNGVMLYVLPRFSLIFAVSCSLQSSFPLCCGAVVSNNMSLSLWLIFVVVLDSNGKSRGYGFVRFACETDQQTAIIEMQGYVGANKKPLRISLAIPKRSVQSAESFVLHLEIAFC